MSILRPLIPLLLLAPILAIGSAAEAQTPFAHASRAKTASRPVSLASLIQPRACVRTGNRMVC